jgi:hypothetical protein
LRPSKLMAGPAKLRDEACPLAVLSRLLILHPERLSAEELRREMLAGNEDFAGVDALARAVRDLTATGLLRGDGDSIVPTRAAQYFHILCGRTCSTAPKPTSRTRDTARTPGGPPARPGSWSRPMRRTMLSKVTYSAPLREVAAESPLSAQLSVTEHVGRSVQSGLRAKHGSSSIKGPPP